MANLVMYFEIYVDDVDRITMLKMDKLNIKMAKGLV